MAKGPFTDVQWSVDYTWPKVLPLVEGLHPEAINMLAVRLMAYSRDLQMPENKEQAQEIAENLGELVKLLLSQRP